MPKIIPEMLNGARRLVLSEAFLMQPNEGLTIEIPLLPGTSGTPSVLKLDVQFLADSDKPRHTFETTGPDSMRLKLFNVLKGSFHSGLNGPLGFTIGNSQFHLLLSLVRIADNVAQMTLTIYQD